MNIRIFFFWILLLGGLLFHNNYHLAELFFGVEIKLPDAKGTVPMAVHVFRIFVDLSILLFALLTLYLKSKIFYRISFVWVLLLCILNYVHFAETLIKELADVSQLTLLALVFVINLILVHDLHKHSLPWIFLPKKFRNWNWAQHQKRWFGKWHLYLGLFAGAILCIVGLTGSILVFQDEIDEALNPEMFRYEKKGEPIAFHKIIPIVQEKFPDKEFDFVRNLDVNDPGSTYRFYHLKEGKEFFVNPYNAEISGRRLIHSAFIRIIMDVHTTLLVPQVGKYITGFASLCMLILTISGLRLWIPNNIRKWKQWKDALTIKFGASFKRQNLDWHNVLGLYSAPVIIVLSLTGFVITFSTVFIGLLFMLNGKSPDSLQEIFNKKSEYKAGVSPMSIDEIYHKNQTIFPSAKLESVHMPSDSSGVYMLVYLAEGRAKTGRVIMTSADQYTGKLLLNSDTDFPLVGKSYMDWTTPLHYGTFGGWPTRILACLAGLIPISLFITGFIIWWPRYKKQKKTGIKVLSPTQVNKAKKIIQERRKLNLPLGKFISYYFKNGLLYAVMILFFGGLGGGLYGVVSGYFLEPAAYTVLYIGMCAIINFAIALMVLVFQTFFLLPFGKSYRMVYKYVVWSLAFFVVFVPVVFLMSWGGLSLF